MPEQQFRDRHIFGNRLIDINRKLIAKGGLAEVKLIISTGNGDREITVEGIVSELKGISVILKITKDGFIRNKILCCSPDQITMIEVDNKQQEN